MDLLTQDEIKTLLTPAYHLTPVLSEAAAKADVDLLFRALHSAYGAYYYFGQDAFDTAEQQVLTWLEGKYPLPEKRSASSFPNRFPSCGTRIFPCMVTTMNARSGMSISTARAVLPARRGSLLQICGRKALGI